MSRDDRDRPSLERQSLGSESFESQSFAELGRQLAKAMDEHHLSDAQRLAQRARRALLESRLLGVGGRVQREGEVLHLIARELVDLSALLGELRTGSRDFR